MADNCREVEIPSVDNAELTCCEIFLTQCVRHVDPLPNIGFPEDSLLRDIINEWDANFIPPTQDFISLTDTPVSYTGEANKVAVVNLTEDSIIFDGDITQWNEAYSWGDWELGVTKTFVDGLGINADMVDGLHATDFATSAQGSLADTATQPGDNISTLINDVGFLESVVGGTNITIDNTDPINPVINSSTGTLQEVTDNGNITTNNIVANAITANNILNVLQHINAFENIRFSPFNNTEFITGRANFGYESGDLWYLSQIYDGDSFSAKLNVAPLTGNRTFIFPDVSGTFALTSDLNLGLQEVTDISNITTRAIVTNAHFRTDRNLLLNPSPPTGTTGYSSFGSNDIDKFYFEQTRDGVNPQYLSVFNISSLTSDREYEYQDKSGIIALLDDLNNYLPTLGGTITGQLSLTGLSTYADDTAAGVGGLVSGDIYQTATGELRIKL